MTAMPLSDEERDVLVALQDLAGWQRIGDIKDHVPWIWPSQVQYRLKTLRSAGLVEYHEHGGGGLWKVKEGVTVRKGKSADGLEATSTGWADTTVKLRDIKPLVKAAAKDAGISMSTWIMWACEEKLERETAYRRD